MWMKSRMFLQISAQQSIVTCLRTDKGVGALLEPALPCHSPGGQQEFSSCLAPLGGMRHSAGDEAEDKTIKLCFSSSKHFKDSIKLICTTAWLNIPSGSPAWLLSLSALPRWWATLPLLFKFLLHFVKILLTLPFWQKPWKTPLIWNKIKCLALSMCKKSVENRGCKSKWGNLSTVVWVKQRIAVEYPLNPFCSLYEGPGLSWWQF